MRSWKSISEGGFGVGRSRVLTQPPEDTRMKKVKVFEGD